MLSIIYYTISSTKFHSDNNFGIIFPPIPFYHEEFNVLIEKKAFVLLIDIVTYNKYTLYTLIHLRTGNFLNFKGSINLFSN